MRCTLAHAVPGSHACSWDAAIERLSCAPLQTHRPVNALFATARGDGATTLPPPAAARGLAKQAALTSLLASRPAGSLASTDPVAAAAADGLLWRSLSRSHSAAKASVRLSANYLPANPLLQQEGMLTLEKKNFIARMCAHMHAEPLC